MLFNTGKYSSAMLALLTTLNYETTFAANQPANSNHPRTSNTTFLPPPPSFDLKNGNTYANAIVYAVTV